MTLNVGRSHTATSTHHLNVEKCENETHHPAAVTPFKVILTMKEGRGCEFYQVFQRSSQCVVLPSTLLQVTL